MISIWIHGDQLLANHPALQIRPPSETTVLLIESASRTRKHAYQRKKLILLFSAMRHYAKSLEAQGYQIDYVQTKGLATTGFLAGIQDHLSRHQPEKLISMASASYGGRQLQNSLAQKLDLPIQILPNTQFLVGTHNPIPNPEPAKRYVMENFYRSMRRHFNILMDNDGVTPVDGQWNFDHDNRKKLPKTITPPPIPPFEPDEITQQVIQEVTQLDHAIGNTDNFGYAVTRTDALKAFNDFLDHRLDLFGPYEDALTTRSDTLFHSVLSPYLNIGLLEPLELVQAVEQRYREGKVRINSAEGFIRQIIGWREFMYWQYWRQMPGMTDKNAWEAHNPLPHFVWTGDTHMLCMSHTIKRALDTGYNHHIERLMVLSNFFMLCGIHPKAVNDWFLALYIDAYEWVMPPNVIGMSLNADGGLTATKPYISSANYINKMGDTCRQCPLDHKKRHGENACPFNYLYWNFILKHEDRLRANPRTSRSVLGLRYLDEADREAVQRQAEQFIAQITTSDP